MEENCQENSDLNRDDYLLFKCYVENRRSVPSGPEAGYQTDAEVARRLASLDENMNISLGRLDAAHALVATHTAKATPRRLLNYCSEFS